MFLSLSVEVLAAPDTNSRTEGELFNLCRLFWPNVLLLLSSVRDALNRLSETSEKVH